MHYGTSMDTTNVIKQLKKMQNSTDDGGEMDAIDAAVTALKSVKITHKAKTHKEPKAAKPAPVAESKVIAPYDYEPVEIVLDPEGKNVGLWSAENDMALKADWEKNVGISRMALTFNRQYKDIEKRITFLYS